MNRDRSEIPAGWAEEQKIDLTQRKTFILINIISGTILLVFFLIGLWIHPIQMNVESLEPVMGKILIVALGALLYIVLHELTHAAVMKIFSADRVRFGFVSGMAYAGSDTLFTRIHYILIAMAPVTLWGVIFLALNLLLPGDWF